MASWSHYELLGVASDADADAIKSAYRRLAKETHPDRPTGTNGLFGLVTHAYDELRDPVARAAYDRKLARGETSAPDPPVQQTQRPSTAAEEARAAAEAQRIRDQAAADRRRERERQRYEEQSRQDEQNVAARARDAAERRARDYSRLLMAAAVFAGYIASYNLEYSVRNSPANHFLPSDLGMPFGVAVLLVLRAVLLLLIGGLLIDLRNHMVKLEPWEVAGICVTWGLVTAMERPPQLLFWIPVLVFVAITGTGVYARSRRRAGAHPTAPPTWPRGAPLFTSPKAPPSGASTGPAPATAPPGNGRPTVASRCPGCGKSIQPDAWILHPGYCAGRT